MLFYFETANKYAVWKKNWVEFCNMAGKIWWIYKFFRENYITGISQVYRRTLKKIRDEEKSKYNLNKHGCIK